MKKTTAYARKMRRHGREIGIVNAASWHNAVERCQPMGETAPIVQGIPRATDPWVLLIEANDALGQLLAHTVAPDNPRPYDCLAAATDVTWLRALQIDRNPATNPIYADLNTARAVLHSMRTRWERVGKWGMTGPEKATMKTAVDHYEAVLLASSAQQMEDANQERQRQIGCCNFFKPEAA